MKKRIRDCFMIIFIGFIVGIFAFLWIYTREIVLTTFTSFLLISILVASLILMSYLSLACSERCHHQKQAFCHCGYLATIGAAGVILSILFLALSSVFTIISAFIVACFFFFYFLMLAGSINFLTRVFHCEHCREEEKPTHPHVHTQAKRYEHYPMDKR